MVLNFERELTAFDGTALKDESSQIVTLKNVAINALLVPSTEGIPGEEKLKRYNLANKIYSSTAIDVTVEEISLVKKLIGDIYPPLIVGQVWTMLEGK